jgi:hypothetical protein
LSGSMAKSNQTKNTWWAPHSWPGEILPSTAADMAVAGVGKSREALCRDCCTLQFSGQSAFSSINGGHGGQGR